MMADMGNYIIGGIIAIFVLVGGLYLVRSRGNEIQASPSGVPVTQQVATSTYASTTLGVSAVYPNNYHVDESYAYDQFGPKKLIHGVKFHIPEAMATGTNLSMSDTGISIEQLPHAKKCTADIYLTENVRAPALTENGVQYTFASSTDAGAGNLYEEDVYALTGSQPCTAIRYFIHSGNIGNYGTSTNVREFDTNALLKDFDAIRASVVLTH